VYVAEVMLYCDPVSSDRASSSLWLASATLFAVTNELYTPSALAGVGPVTDAVVADAAVPQPCTDSSSPSAASGPIMAMSARGMP